jgi:hypothetical protein
MSDDFQKWMGASKVDSALVFHGGTKELIDMRDGKYAGVVRYLPGPDYLIGRIVTQSRNSNDPVLKVFVNGAWDGTVRQELELAEFKVTDGAGLVSDIVPKLGTGGWRAVSKIEIRSDQHPEGHLSAKISFAYKNMSNPKAAVEERVDAFWCWP